ncbi:MAG TPA: hypothetical protein VF065_12295, partial [Ilumatobacter sp.]
DEDAVRRLDADRTMFAHTLARVALTQTSTPTCAIGLGGLGVGGRVRALLDPPVLRRRTLWAGVTTVGISAMVVASAIQLHHVLPLLSTLCPH